MDSGNDIILTGGVNSGRYDVNVGPRCLDSAKMEVNGGACGAAGGAMSGSESEDVSDVSSDVSSRLSPLTPSPDLAQAGMFFAGTPVIKGDAGGKVPDAGRRGVITGEDEWMNGWINEILNE